MLRKTSVSMMVLLVVAASLIGISSIHQYIEGQAPRAKVLSGTGTVNLVRMFDSSAGKACTATIQIAQGPNSLKLKPGTVIDLVAPNEHFCTLIALVKMSQNPEIGITAQNIKATNLPPAIQGALNLPANHPSLYRVTELDV
jgi:hypothetical protein